MCPHKRVGTHNHQAIGVSLAFSMAILAGGLWAADWEPGEGCRSRALPVPASGKTFLQRLEPATTGIHFTNFLSEEKALENSLRTSGAGVAAGDVDGDGWCDLYFCGMQGRNALYRNLGNWRFEDVTASAGVACEGQHSTGAVFADVDGDGDLDLLVTSLGGGTRLFLNDGKGHFTEATDSGLFRRFGATSMALLDEDCKPLPRGQKDWGLSVMFRDLDGDGAPDIYICNDFWSPDRVWINDGK